MADSSENDMCGGRRVFIGPHCVVRLSSDNVILWSASGLASQGILTPWRFRHLSSLCTSARQFVSDYNAVTERLISDDQLKAMWYTVPPLVFPSLLQKSFVDVATGSVCGPPGSWASNPSFVEGLLTFGRRHGPKDPDDPDFNINKQPSTHIKYDFSSIACVVSLLAPVSCLRENMEQKGSLLHIDQTFKLLDLLVSTSDPADPCRYMSTGWECLSANLFSEFPPDLRATYSYLFKRNVYQKFFGASVENPDEYDKLLFNGFTPILCSSEPSTANVKTENEVGESSTSLSSFFVRAMSVKRNQLSNTFLSALLLARFRGVRSAKSILKQTKVSNGVPTPLVEGTGCIIWKPEFCTAPNHVKFYIRSLLLANNVASTMGRLATAVIRK